MNKEEQEIRQNLLKGHEPIYEKLAHNEVLLLERTGNTVIYAVNRLGTVKLKQVYLEDN